MLTVYSKPRCMQCEVTKIWLNRNKIDYKTIDIEENSGALEMLRHYGWKSLPVVSIDDELSDKEKTWSGYQPDRLEVLIK